MGRMDEIRSVLLDWAAKAGPASTMLGIVKDVNPEEYTCTLDVDDLDVHDVRLRPVLDGKQSVTVIPKVGTMALAVRVDTDDDWMVLGVSEAAAVRFVTGNATYEINNDGILLKKGDDTLKDALTLMVQAVQQIVVIYGNNPDYDKLKQAQDKINNLLR